MKLTQLILSILILVLVTSCDTRYVYVVPQQQRACPPQYGRPQMRVPMQMVPMGAGGFIPVPSGNHIRQDGYFDRCDGTGFYLPRGFRGF